MATLQSSYERLVETVGTPDFDTALLTAAQPSGIDEIFGYRVSRRGPPVHIASAGRRGDVAVRTSRYLSEFYVSDPIWSGAPAYRANELKIQQVPISEIPSGPYRDECFSAPRFSQKICIISGHGSHAYVLSLYSRVPARSHSGAINALARMALPLLRRHLGLASDDKDLPLEERLEARIALSFPELSARERAVAARTIAGWTSPVIADALGIGASSVITYRRRAYARTSVSAAGQMLARLLD